jgi:photosystem II stability/assembly factor-like uncharacterized protein
MNIQRVLIRGLLVAVWVAGLSACGGGSDPSPAAPPVSARPTGQALLGAAGGQVLAVDGASLTVPQGALRGDLRISMARDGSEAPPLPPLFKPAGDVFSLLPHGTRLALPVTVRLPFDPVLVASGERPAVLKTSPGEPWELIEDVRVEGNMLVFETSSFSWLSGVALPPRRFLPPITQPPPPTPPTLAPGDAVVNLTPAAGFTRLPATGSNVSIVQQSDPAVRVPIDIEFGFGSSSPIEAACGGSLLVSIVYSPAAIYRLPSDGNAAGINRVAVDTSVAEERVPPVALQPDDETSSGFFTTRGLFPFPDRIYRGSTAVSAVFTQWNPPAFDAFSGLPTNIIPADAIVEGWGVHVTLQVLCSSNPSFRIPTAVQPVVVVRGFPVDDILIIARPPTDVSALQGEIVGLAETEATAPAGVALIHTWEYLSPGASNWIPVPVHTGLPTSEFYLTQGASVGTRPVVGLGGRLSQALHDGWRLRYRACVNPAPNGVPRCAYSNEMMLRVSQNYPPPQVVRQPSVTGTATFNVGQSLALETELTPQVWDRVPVWQTRRSDTEAWAPVSPAEFDASFGRFSINSQAVPFVHRLRAKPGTTLGTTDRGRQFRAAYTTPNGTVTTNAVTIQVTTGQAPPSFTAQPQPATVGTGSPALFAAGVTGAQPMSYRWLFNGQPITGANGPLLTLNAVNAANAGTYQLEVSNVEATVLSAAARLTVTSTPTPAVEPPLVIQDPTPVTVVRGSSVAFTAVARGTGPLSYQWFFNGQPMAGRDFQVLGIGTVTDTDAGLYTVRISNSAGSILSNPARLTVAAPGQAPVVPPTITTQPATLSAFTGQTVNMAVAASGSGPISYQWRRNGVNLPSDGPVLTLTNLQTANAGTYSVVVSNSAGTVTSSDATLTVNAPPTSPAPPAAPTIVTQPVNTIVTEGNTATLAVGVNGTTPMSFQWSRGGVAISGATAAAYTVPSATPANAGSYSVTISNSSGSVTSATVTLAVNAAPSPPASVAPSISTQPVGLTASVGQTVTLAVAANGTGPLTYQWRRSGSVIPSTDSPILTLSNVQPANAGDYTVTVSNSAGSVTSNVAGLVVTPVPGTPVITASPGNRSVALGATATFTATVTGNPAPQCQWIRNGIGIPGATSCTSYTTPATTLADNGAVYNLVAFNTAGAVFGSGAVLTVQVAAPQIQSESGNQIVNAGSAASFSVSATGTELRYQWFRNGLALLNATGTTYTLQNAQLADNGASFTVQVCNSTAAGGQCVTSSAMTLTVNGGLNVGPPASVGACFGGQFGWCYVQPAPMANRLTGLVFEASGSGLTIVGEAGTVLSSSDFGGTVTASWQTPRYAFSALASPSPGRLVAAIDDQNDPNVRGMYLSTDGGSTWTRTAPSDLTVGVAFKDALVGVAVGPEQILRTTDGGSSWTTLNVPAIVPPNATNLTGVAYAGSDVFVASGIGRGVRSTDGGLTWSVVPDMIAANANLTSVVFNGQGVGLALNDSQPVAARSTDFGANWSTVTLPFVAPRAAYGGANTVVILGGYSRHARSTDGGLNWSPEAFSLPIGQQQWRPFMRNPQQGIAIGDYGAIARTVDGGETWNAIAGGNFNNTVWAIEANPNRSVLLAQINGGLKRSTDGRIWNDNATSVLATTFRQTISWGSNTVATAASSFEGVHISTDAGDTWTEIRPPTGTGNYPAVAMADEQTLIVTSFTVVNGVIQSFVDRSTNAGQSWTRVNLPGLDASGVLLTAARFVSPTLGFVAGSAGTPGTARLWRTENAGASWLQITLPDVGTNNRRDTIQAIQPGPSGTIFMATDSALLRSTDTGFNWSRVLDSSDIGSMTDVRFSGSTGIAVGVGGIWRTDNGATWTRLNLPLSGATLATEWAPGGLVLAGGDGGMLLANQSLGNLAVRPDNPSFKQTLRLSPPSATRSAKDTTRRGDTRSQHKPKAASASAQPDARTRALLQPPPLRQRVGRQWVSVPRGAPARFE